MSPSRSEILDLMRTLGVPVEVIRHCTKVESVAMEIARGISGNGVDLDPDLVSIGALLHDVGRSVTQGIDHGIAGAGILTNDERCLEILGPTRGEALARICQVHIGAGIPAKDAVAMGLPERDFLPITVEEKIIAHADNLVWNGILAEAESLAAHERKLGAGSPAFARIVALADEIHGLSGGRT